MRCQIRPNQVQRNALPCCKFQRINRMLPNIRAPILMLALLMVAGCSSATLDAATAPSPTMPRPTAGSVPGHVYLVRGLVGEVFSLGFYDLAGRVKERGINASVHSMYAPGLLANEIIAVYRRAPAPIVLIGHSSGADAVIGVAEKLKSANVPVILMFGFDPTPIAGRVPENVELFINLYQKTNLIGGGEVKAFLAETEVLVDDHVVDCFRRTAGR